MTFLIFVLFTIACVHADGRNHMAAKCTGIQGKTGGICNPTACANRDTSCPLIPDVLCASDECGCRVAFFAVVNQTGRETRMDVTDLCQATAEIKEASDLMEGLLNGDVERRDFVASDPDVLFHVFGGLNTFSVRQLRLWISALDSAVLYDRTPAMEKRRQYFHSELAALEERMRSREFQDANKVIARARHVSDASTQEVQKDLQQRKDIIRQWTKKQERVQVLDESVSMNTLVSSARIASKKYAVDSQGSIIGSQLPIYGNIISIAHSLLSTHTRFAHYASRSGGSVNDPSNGYRIPELFKQLVWIALDEVIARRQLRRSNFRFTLPQVSRTNSRTRFNFHSFAPLVLDANADAQSVLRVMSLASQTAALGMDLYSNLVGQSPTTLAGFVEDWNIADDLTEFVF